MRQEPVDIPPEVAETILWAYRSHMSILRTGERQEVRRGAKSILQGMRMVLRAAGWQVNERMTALVPLQDESGDYIHVNHHEV